MHLAISKSRLRRIVRLRRQLARRQDRHVPFRNGSVLACLYLGAAFLGTMALAIFLPYNGCNPGSARLAALLATDVAIFGCAALSGRLLLGQLAPETVDRNSRLLMLLLVGLLSNALTAGVVQTAHRMWPALQPLAAEPRDAVLPFLLPHLFAPGLATQLAGPGAGISLGLALAMQSPLFVPREAALAASLCGAMVAIVGPLLLARVHRRSQVVRAYLGVGLLQLFAAVVATGPFLPKLFREALAATGGAGLPADAFLALGSLLALQLLPALVATTACLPFLEHLFAACSNVRLNAFADLSAPLLSRLALDAPGTFHHSMVVANLAAAAAEQIGANALLARVGAYYHDVGKLSHPDNYTENLGVGARNPHDALPPNMSAIILSSHVKDGEGFAVDANLPVPIRRIILEHHGNSLMLFFYNKALQQAAAKASESGQEPERVDENQFRYPCPRPSSAEAAIVSLADSVEAASRSLANPTPSAIEKLVDSIVAAKAADGQLDASPLTYADVNEIRRVFASVLPTILHARGAYPKAPYASGKPPEAEAPSAEAKEPRHDERPSRPAPAKPEA